MTIDEMQTAEMRQALEDAGYVVLDRMETATVYEAMSVASSHPSLDDRIDARSELEARIEKLYGDDGDGERILKWLPT